MILWAARAIHHQFECGRVVFLYDDKVGCSKWVSSRVALAILAQTLWPGSVIEYSAPNEIDSADVLTRIPELSPEGQIISLIRVILEL